MPTAPALGLAPAPANAPKESRATQKARTQSSTANAAPARAIAKAGIGAFPGVNVVGGKGRAAQLPTPLPVPQGMQTLASVNPQGAVGRWLKERVIGALQKAPRGRQPYRSPEELMALGKASPPTAVAVAPPPQARSAVDSFDDVLRSGPAVAVPPPSVKRTAAGTDADFFGGW